MPDGVSFSIETSNDFILPSLVGADSIDLIDDAVQTAVHYNALGVLVTDWSAYGHLSPLEVSLPAFAAGAALSWNSKIKQVRPVSLCPPR